MAASADVGLVLNPQPVGERRLESGVDTPTQPASLPFGIAKHANSNGVTSYTKKRLIDWDIEDPQLSTPMGWSNGWAKRSGGVNFPEFVYAGFDNQESEQNVFAPKKKRLIDWH